MKSNVWAPVSGNAYGGNAVFIPEYGKKPALEFIMVMHQNYPEYKTHPALDVFHGYVNGMERFEHNHEMRVLGWDIRPEKRQWSFLYLPAMCNDVMAVAAFSATEEGRMRLELELRNPSDEARQWEFHFYIAPCGGLELPLEISEVTSDGYRLKIDGIGMELKTEGIAFRDAVLGDSNFWINFPLNAECVEDEDNPRNRYKKRLKLRTRWIDIAPHATAYAAIDFLPDGTAECQAPEKFIPASGNLPYRHMHWEALHNRQYVRKFSAPETMEFRHIPARQWGRFFIWDCGMTAAGLAEEDAAYAEEIIESMPDPADGPATFNHGSYIITAIYALWEMRNPESVRRHYAKMKRLLEHVFDVQPGEDYDGLASANRGTGADDSPALFYAKGEIFAWDYRKTLPTNPDHEKQSLICIGLTAHALRCLKIMRIFAEELGLREDVESFTVKIDAAEKTLNCKYWSDKHGCYLDRPANEPQLLEIPWIYDYLPLFSGSVPPERLPGMLEALITQYFTPNGFAIVSPNSPYYRAEGYPNGSSWPPLQYFFWKTLIALGEMAAARRVAERYLTLYEHNHAETLCCWEQYRVDTGRGAGNMRFSGFTTPVIAMHRAHRKFGSIQTGYDLRILSAQFDESGAALELYPPFFSGITGLSIVLKPNTDYEITVGGETHPRLRSDTHGWLGISLSCTAGEPLEISFKSFEYISHHFGMPGVVAIS